MQDQHASGAEGEHAPELPRNAPAAEAKFPLIRRRIGLFRPFVWLRLGLRDLCAAPGMSLAYGLCFATMGWILRLVLANAPQYLAAMTTGFLLLGPLFAIGLYDMSRRIERGEPEMTQSLFAVSGRLGNVGLLAIVLGVIMLVWARATLVVFALFYNKGMPTVESFMAQLFSLESVEFLVAYGCIGFIFASIVFAISWVSIPIMLDRDRDSITSIIISVVALYNNPLATTAWALMIVGFVVLGFLSWNIGLIITMPIVGHATWHAYREVVVWDDAPP